LFCAEAFVLPSHQENFGVAVAEALSCGVPVLISDKVNIWREIAAAGAGLVDTDDLEGTRRLLVRWLALSNGAQQAMREPARRLFVGQFTVNAMAAGLINLIDEQRQPAGAFDHGR
jgi:glycosyltransferase involved in cell wall biosynthesis